MQKNGLSDYLSLTNPGLSPQEVLFEYHCKIEAMLDILLLVAEDKYSHATLHEYLSIISDLVEQATVINQSLIKA